MGIGVRVRCLGLGVLVMRHKTWQLDLTRDQNQPNQCDSSTA